jgi:hypothetical protein
MNRSSAMPDRTRQVRCPDCGHARALPVATMEDLGRTQVVRGLPSLKSIGAKMRERFADSGHGDAGAWIDLPPCPRCGTAYQYNVQTGEQR